MKSANINNRSQCAINMTRRNGQTGFSLIELLVGLAIGALVSLVIMNVFSVFEGEKRTTMGGADAQTSGNIALYNISRDIQQAGFGMPVTVAGGQNSIYKCDKVAQNGALLDLNVNEFSPLVITNGATGLGDAISVRYSNNQTGGLPTKIISRVSATLTVDNRMGCNNGELALQVSDGAVPSCILQPIQSTAASATPPYSTVTLLDDTKLKNNGYLYCIGQWNNFAYQVRETAVGSGKFDLNRQVTRITSAGAVTTSNVTIAPEVVSMQAQYGVSATGSSNTITLWTDATGIWAPGNLSAVNRNRIKAVRIAIATRNPLREKTAVTPNACITMYGDCTNAASVAAIADGALQLDISDSAADWQNYRYRVYETVIPVRNAVWTKF